MLSKKQLSILRNEIVLNSLFRDDYNNSLFIKPEAVQMFFDSFIEYIADYYNTDDLDIIFKHCTINRIYNYYISYFNDIDDPLLQNDYIASCCLCNYGGIGVLQLDDDFIVFRHDYKTSYNADISKIKKHRLYYDYKKQDSYFIDNNKRYYLSEFMRSY